MYFFFTLDDILSLYVNLLLFVNNVLPLNAMLDATSFLMVTITSCVDANILAFY